MSDSEQVMMQTRRLETLLRMQYHAQGDSLEALINSCADRLPHDVLAKLRYVASIGGDVMQQEHYQLDDRKAFLAVCLECEKELTPRSGRFIWRVAVMLMLLMTLAAMVVYYIHWEELSQHLQ
ncbi:DUF4145 domain-containing protein [Vibrio furnissii]|uniref:DUF4145 domain-containing protein n=1 Tax=Vibrio furnissii TaxID=29494 RepID=UPI001302BB20|nr:DUF4145 domain-containing protein [Vibrio furnissii]MCG6269100.1 DUF4145 domain-containing protein [Vibrio furnissii]